MKEIGANKDRSETLKELLKNDHSPWFQDYSWSDEAKSLREIAVNTPHLINEDFIYNHFKTLRISNKKVTYVDRNLKKFKRLAELSLNGNEITEVNFQNLPATIEVLELCANRITDVTEMFSKPLENLKHLGLGYNSLSSIHSIGQNNWPELLSLDLSYNNIINITQTISALQTLPRLRNLILSGNPLTLVPWYRGYVIDSLQGLTYLDDVGVSASERHNFKFFRKHQAHAMVESVVTFGLDYISGLPMPEEIKNPTDQPDYPVITRHYFVRFTYLAASDAERETIASALGNSGAQSAGHSPPLITTNDVADAIGQVSANFTSREHSTKDRKEDDSRAGSQLQSIEGDASLAAEINSSALAWSEKIEFNWKCNVRRNDLMALRDYLQKGMEIAVMEKRVHSYPADRRDSADEEDVKKGGKKDKNEGKKDDKKKKKKGESDVELKSMPAEFHEISRFHLPLATALDGCYVFDKTFTQDISDDDFVLGKGSGLEALKKETKKDKKTASAGKKKPEKADGKKSPKVDKKGEGKNSKGGKGMQLDNEEDVAPPPPLVCQLGFKVHQWLQPSDWAT